MPKQISAKRLFHSHKCHILINWKFTRKFGKLSDQCRQTRTFFTKLCEWKFKTDDKGNLYLCVCDNNFNSRGSKLKSVGFWWNLFHSFFLAVTHLSCKTANNLLCCSKGADLENVSPSWCRNQLKYSFGANKINPEKCVYLNDVRFHRMSSTFQATLENFIYNKNEQKTGGRVLGNTALLKNNVLASWKIVIKNSRTSQ